ncbi:hypothetical protein [Halobaculum rubrum]|uniref:hypothetical protein n=1 Tax=Halobaculum rubrum TaxID=2872158 RepID=UPI001CA44D49|nr:hypothetical protein [Halobaculum rubrum]QZY01193.1 hypothetical protein K6T25_15125 [Halobaculum rubrum]
MSSHGLLECPNCHGLFIVEKADQVAITCPRCQHTRLHRNVRYTETGPVAELREIRSRLNADRAGEAHPDQTVAEQGDQVYWAPSISDGWSPEYEDVFQTQAEQLAERQRTSQREAFADEVEFGVDAPAPVRPDEDLPVRSPVDEANAIEVEDVADLPAVTNETTLAFETAGQTFVDGGQQSLAAEVSELEPTVTETDRLLEALLPATIGGIADFARRRDFDARTAHQLAHVLIHERGIVAGNGAWAHAAAKFALIYQDSSAVEGVGETWSDRIDAVRRRAGLSLTADGSISRADAERQVTRATLLRTLTAFASGQDAAREGFGREDLIRSVVPALALRERPPRLRVTLDRREWLNVLSGDDTRRIERLLDVLEVLSIVVDVRITVPGGLDGKLFGELEEALPVWTDERLTETRDRFHSRSADGHDRPAPLEAYRAARKYAGRGSTKKYSVLAALSQDDLQRASAVVETGVCLAADGSVYGYLADLADAGLAEQVGHKWRQTPLGAAAAELLNDALVLVHPEQQANWTGLATPCNSTNKCSAQRQPSHGEGDPAGETATADRTDRLPPTARSLDRDIARVKPPQGATHLQYFGEYDADHHRYSSEFQHRVLRSLAQDAVVTSVDTPTEELYPAPESVDRDLEDGDDLGAGKVTQANFNSKTATLVAPLQWGGSDSMLTRLGRMLFDPHLWEQMSMDERIGDDLGRIPLDGLDIDDDVEGYLYGHQFGWLATDDDHPAVDPDKTVRANWVARVRGRCAHLLELLADDETYQNAEQGKALKELGQGILTMGTKLLHAVGIEVVFPIRVPNVGNLLRNPSALADFCDFFRYTVPKHFTFGHHAANRHTVETDGERLKHRLSLEMDETDRHAEPTAQWVIQGGSADPTAAGADDLRPFVEDALGAVEPREAVAEGAEDAPVIDISVTSASTYRWARDYLERELAEKGWEDLRGDRSQWVNPDSDDIERLARVLVAMTARGEAWRTSGLAIAEAVHSLPAREGTEQLTTRDIEYALSQISPEHVLPTLPPSAGKCLQELLAADEPLRARELYEERVGISESMWRTIREDLEGLQFVTREDDGLLVATVSPWWSSRDGGVRTLDDEEELWMAAMHEDGHVNWGALVLLDDADLLHNPDGAFGADVWKRPPKDIDIGELRALDRRLGAWAPVIATLVDEAPDQEAMTVARVGRLPAGLENRQTALVAGE